MRKTWFTIYFSPKNDDNYLGLLDYNAILELLLAIKIDDKINKAKKVKKNILMFYTHIENFKKLYEKKPWQGIVNLSISTKNINCPNHNHNRVTIYSSNLSSVVDNDIANDYRIEVWPTNDMEIKVLNHYMED